MAKSTFLNYPLVSCCLSYFQTVFGSIVSDFLWRIPQKTLLFLVFRSNRFLASARWMHVQTRGYQASWVHLERYTRGYFTRALLCVWKKRYIFCTSRLSFLRFKEVSDSISSKLLNFPENRLVLHQWWVALQSACTFRGVCITQPFLNLGRRASERNSKDFSRWDVISETLSRL